MDGLITSWNRAAEKMYGYTAAEAIGRHLSLLLPPERQAETRALMERIGNGLPVECLELKLRGSRRAGCVLDVSLSIVSPIRDAKGSNRGRLSDCPGHHSA